jgi:hypothetical protein
MKKFILTMALLLTTAVFADTPAKRGFTIGGGVITRTSDLILLSCTTVTANNWAAFKRGGTESYWIPATKEFRVVALRAIEQTSHDRCKVSWSTGSSESGTGGDNPSNPGVAGYLNATAATPLTSAFGFFPSFANNTAAENNGYELWIGEGSQWDIPQSVSTAAVSEITDVTAVAEAGNIDGTYFLIYDNVGSVAVWFDVGDTGSLEPTHGANRSIEVTGVGAGNTANQVAAAIQAAVDADPAFSAPVPGAAVVNITEVTGGDRIDGSAQTSPFTVVVSQQGQDARGYYLNCTCNSSTSTSFIQLWGYEVDP